MTLKLHQQMIPILVQVNLNRMNFYDSMLADGAESRYGFWMDDQKMMMNGQQSWMGGSWRPLNFSGRPLLRTVNVISLQNRWTIKRNHNWTTVQF